MFQTKSHLGKSGTEMYSKRWTNKDGRFCPRWILQFAFCLFFAELPSVVNSTSMCGLTHRVKDKQPTQYRTHSTNDRSQTYKYECQTVTTPSTLLYYSFLLFFRHSLFAGRASHHYISQVRQSYLTHVFHFLTTRIITPCHKSGRHVHPILPYKMRNLILFFQPLETPLYINFNSNSNPGFLWR